MNNRKTGIEGESQAVEFLQNKGYKILERNYSCKIGEIDIVAKDKETLVFVEVKARKNTLFGMPVEAITPAKVRNIIGVARYFLLAHKLHNVDCRFDVICILKNKIEHIENAFEVCGR